MRRTTELSQLMPLLPLIVVFITVMLASSAKKNQKKKSGKTGAGKPQVNRQAASGAGGNARGAKVSKDPYGRVPADSEGMSVPGSLGAGSLEGMDPCHDDPAAVPQGSLRVERAEGADPCHDDWRPAARTPETRPEIAEQTGGLELKWTGNEVVKGFVYGEILKRRT